MTDAAETLRVLVVDDHAALADALMIALAAEGMEAATVERFGVVDVLAVADHFEPHVALLDFYLADGRTAQPLVAPLTERGVAVVILTAGHDTAELGATLVDGASAVLRKTQPLSETIAAIQAVAAGEEAMSAQARARLLFDAHRARERPPPAAERFDRLSPRERGVLAALIAGRGTAEIAAEHFVGEATVRTQVQSILRKLEVNSRLAAVALARDVGWRA